MQSKPGDRIWIADLGKNILELDGYDGQTVNILPDESMILGKILDDEMLSISDFDSKTDDVGVVVIQ
jgi:hypothetical protein